MLCQMQEKKTASFLTSASMALYKWQGSAKKAVKILKNFGFMRGNVDPCLNVKKSLKGIVYIACYVGSNLMLGNFKVTDNALSALKNNGLVLKVLEGLQDYLSYEIKFSKDKRRAWLGRMF